MSMNGERWLPVVGFEGRYEVSDHGRVRSVDRIAQTATGARRYRGVMLRPGTVESGHQLVVLGKGNSRLIHALVLAAFVGPRPAGHDSLHHDGNPANNRLENLRWGTRSENVRDAQRHGTYRGGQPPGRNPRAVLRDEHIPTIRKMLRDGVSYIEIGRKFGVGRSAIYLVKVGRNWSHIQEVAP